MPLLIAVLVFFGVTGVIVGIWWATEPGRILRQRLATAGPGGGVNLQAEILRAQQEARTVLGASLNSLLQRAGYPGAQTEVLTIMTGLAAVGGLIGMLRMGGLLWAILAGVLAGALPLMYLAYRAGKRMDVFQRDFPDALDMMTRSIRAGHALGGAIRLVGEEMPPPIGPEFMRVSEEMRLGLDPNEALASLAERVPAEDVKFFSTAVAIHRTTGGNLAEVLDRLTEVIRDRYRLLSQARVLASQHKWSAILIGLSPIGFALLFQILNPRYFDAFWESDLAPRLIALGLISEAIGFLLIWRISRIKI